MSLSYLDNRVQPHCYQVPKDRYRHLYFEALELAFGEVERRFEQPDFAVIENLESSLIRTANGESVVLGESLLRYLEGDIAKDRFITQLPLIPDMIKTAFVQSPIKKVTTLRTIADAMNKSEIYKGMLSEIHKVLKIYFTFPVTTSTAERSFSSMHRLKTYFRNTMTQSRLNNLLLLYVHSSETDKLDIKDIAREFISVND